MNVKWDSNTWYKTKQMLTLVCSPSNLKKLKHLLNWQFMDLYIVSIIIPMTWNLAHIFKKSNKDAFCTRTRSIDFVKCCARYFNITPTKTNTIRNGSRLIHTNIIKLRGNWNICRVINYLYQTSRKMPLFF